MAKDDYYVLVYQVMKYLYECLKTGEKVDSERLTAKAMNIPETYWFYIFENLLNQGFVTDVHVLKTLGGESLDISQIQITPKGIEYLFENSLFSKAKKALKEVKDSITVLYHPIA